ncbi:MAG: ECF transporter S component [Clostridia bacterium]|nr:ECF transporter S component [Clostridia bacterium]
MNKLTITKTKKIILSAMFLSILIILSRFLSIKTALLVISFSFIPIMLSAIYLGPKYSAIIAGLRRLNRGNSISIWSLFSWVYNYSSFNGIYLWYVFI